MTLKPSAAAFSCALLIEQKSANASIRGGAY